MLDRFLAPRSVAVIGASPDHHKIRGALLHLLRQTGFDGAIFPVNPSYDAIDGIACHKSVAAIGAPVDLALIAIPAAGVLPALQECAAAGVANAVVITSGFAEDAEAPADLQDAVAALARSSGMRICGPNAEGFHNEVARVTATFSPAVEARYDSTPIAIPHRIGVVAQSGGMGFALFNRGRTMGLQFSSVVSTGNEADLTAADFFAHMAADPDTAGVLLFLEAIRDPAGFKAAAAAAAAANKPVVAIKVGRSAAGSQAAQSHTASMAGWDAGYDALFRRYGITVAADLDEALAIMAARLTNPPARGRRCAILTISGGAGALAADALSLAGLEVPELSAATQAAIRAFIPSYGSTRNPVDLTAGGAQGGGTLRALEILFDDDAVDLVAIVTTLANPTRTTLDGPALRALVTRRRKPVLLHSYTLASPLGLRTMAEAGVAVLPSMTLLGQAARAVLAVPLPGAAPALPATLDGHPDGALSEHDAKAVLAGSGVAVAPCRLVRHAAELDAAADAIGFPLALKIQSATITHKTEIGGVRLGVDKAGLHATYAEVLANARLHAPGAAIQGVLLEPMAPKGVEVIVGIVRDPVAGPVVTLGAGGTQAELVGDAVHRLAPVDAAEAAAMLGELRTAPLLHGFRGAPPADAAALASLVALVSQLAAGSERVAELELNPVIVHPAGAGCTVADALLVLATPTAQRSTP